MPWNRRASRAAAGQVVGGGEGVKIPGEVQVHLLHRHHLGHAAPGGLPDPEHGAEARLANGGDAGLADVVWSPWRADRGDRLALPRGSGVMALTSTSLPGCLGGA